MSIREQATETAIDVIDGVARTIADIAESRAKEPAYWAKFHTLQERTLPRWRWLARLHHRRMGRRYRSHMHARKGQ